jgi:hypothetical protein
MQFLKVIHFEMFNIFINVVYFNHDANKKLPSSGFKIL